jgi:mono/diheme cytochrome c family protein
MKTNDGKRMLIGVAGAALIAIATLRAGVADTGSSPAMAERVARGEYLVTVALCNDCHTPWTMGPQGPEPDMSRMLSGHPADIALPPSPIPATSPWGMAMSATNTAFAGPWGVSYAANLTPANHGLGAWDEAIFIQAIRSGRHWGQSRPILPPMPWPWLARMTDEDLKSIFAYLRTIPPIENDVPEPLPPADTIAEAAWQ